MHIKKSLKKILENCTLDEIKTESARLYVKALALEKKSQTYKDKARALAVPVVSSPEYDENGRLLKTSPSVKTDVGTVVFCQPSKDRDLFDIDLLMSDSPELYRKMFVDFMTLGLIDKKTYFSVSNIEKWLKFSGVEKSDSVNLDRYIIKGTVKKDTLPTLKLVKKD